MNFALKSLGRAAVFVAALVTLLNGCAQNYGSPQEAAAKACTSLGPRALSGALIGGAGGAAAGAALGATAGHGGRDAAIGALAGLLVGAIAGAMKGQNLDAEDCKNAQNALQQLATAPTNQTVSWSSPTGSRGTFMPVSDTYTGPNNQICRKIQADYYIKDHQPVSGDPGIVCRNEQGDWIRQSA